MTDLALVMIVRNEERCIARCLQSALPFVDQMIVLDTGSTDDTVKIAASLGAQVHHFVWCDDFAAARNAALDHSPARWNLVLDADEWISDRASKADLAAIVEGGAPFLGLLPISSEFDLQGRVEVETSWVARVLPSGVRYRGRIHEQPVSGLASRKLAFPVLHDGYRRELAEQKMERNERLLLKELESAPSDPYLRYQLGKYYEACEDYAQAVIHYRLALALIHPDAMYRHPLVVRTIFSMKMAQLHEEAIELASAEMDHWQHSPDFFFVVGDLFLDWAARNPAAAMQELLPVAEASWLKCLAIGDQPGLPGTVTGRGSHLAAHNLAVLYQGLGDTEQAARYAAQAAQAGASVFSESPPAPGSDRIGRR